MTDNIAAFLRALRVGEGTSDDAGYRRLVGGGEFVSFAMHPGDNVQEFPPGGPRSFTVGGFYNRQFDSTASGAYQITRQTWRDLRGRKEYRGAFTDFTPAMQDKFATALISLAGALDDVRVGKIATAVRKVAPRWESLPGSGTRPKNEVTLAQFLDNYRKFRGSVA